MAAGRIHLAGSGAGDSIWTGSGGAAAADQTSTHQASEPQRCAAAATDAVADGEGAANEVLDMDDIIVSSGDSTMEIEGDEAPGLSLSEQEQRRWWDDWDHG